MFVVASDEDWNGGLGEEDAYAMLWRMEKHRVMNTCKGGGGGGVIGYQDSHQIRTIWRHFAFWYNIFALTNAHKVWVKNIDLKINNLILILKIPQNQNLFWYIANQCLLSAIYYNNIKTAHLVLFT